ncbi:cysteine/serine endopeptidase inhibitor [Streptomyces roseolilacinus]|uniref:Fibronectin type-III domain-containing protein n=1 Tax=Streptomyces roseolilacinus TaxID=66904 RepID=A0A918AZJ4_9ACTN|nr:hypothetical protein GCM10010249_14450 [Streptomyces roseolilacinus]
MQRTFPQRWGRWAGTLLGTVLVTVLGIGTAFAALPIGEPRTGRMTWYDDAGTGACGTPIHPATEDLVAVSHLWWTSTNPNNDELCRGISVQVTYNGRTLTVPVRDKCPSCAAEHIDLSKAAFQKLADTDLGVVHGITWKFVYTNGGDGGGSDTRAPSTPTGLRSTATTSSSVSLVWAPSTDDTGVTGYDVYRGSTRVATVPGTGTTVGGLSPSTAYTFAVAARDAAGNVSAPSGAVTVTTGPGSGSSCPAAWSATTSYVPGDRVSYAGRAYASTHYSTGAVPNAPSSWAVWRDEGACG